MSMQCMAASSGGEEKARAVAMVTTTGYCYSESATAVAAASSVVNNPNIQSHVVSFESNPEIYNLSAGMEMIGFPSSKNQSDSNHNSSVVWKEFFGKPGNNMIGVVPSSKSSESDHQFYHQQDFGNNNKADFSTGISDTTHETLMAAQDHHHRQSWNDNRSVLMDDPSSLRSVVFPCEGNERPSQGLSLSLGSSNPSIIGVQSFELRHHQDNLRFGPSSSRLNLQQQQQIMLQDGFLGKSHVNNLHHHNHHHQGGLFQIRNSKYLAPALELLKEFCNLGTNQSDHDRASSKMKLQKTSNDNNNNQWGQQDDQGNTSNLPKMQSLYPLDLLELQKRKTKLLQMLEEVDRRYKHYCNQMKAVVSSFEAVAGNGAATTYSALASNAMSRHFRCLRDGIVGQIKATKKALGEKDTVVPGTTRGDTPRLRLLDQSLRQQKAFQQMNMMESHPWRPQRGLPERAVSVLRAWLFEHFLHPYPSDVDKHILARQTGLSRSQVSNWFINARVRLWKPMVEEMYIEETKELENVGSLEGDDHQNPHHRYQDQKPTQDQLVRIDSECLSSIINNPDKNDGGKGNRSSLDDEQHQHSLQQFQSFGRVSSDAFGAVELDFSSYNHPNYGAGGSSSGTAGAGSGGGGVSLTLGLQQHGGAAGEVSLAFSPHPSQNSLFYSRDQLEDCQTVQYSLLESESQNLPYRNLMGAQLLHDLAG